MISEYWFLCLQIIQDNVGMMIWRKHIRRAKIGRAKIVYSKHAGKTERKHVIRRKGN